MKKRVFTVGLAILLTLSLLYERRNVHVRQSRAQQGGKDLLQYRKEMTY